jgi:hypothetical protein
MVGLCPSKSVSKRVIEVNISSKIIVLFPLSSKKFTGA